MGNPLNALGRTSERHELAWILGTIAAVAAVGICAVLVADSFVATVGIAAFAIVCAWLLLPGKRDNAPKLLVLFTSAFVFSSLIPTSANLALQALAVVSAVIAWLRVPAAERRGRNVVGFALAILVLWAAFMFNPNVPDLSTGLLGFRKTAFCVAGVIAGCAVPRRMLGSVEVMVVRVLILAVSVSIVAFLFVPQLEALVNRSADQYTALIGGQKRLQGVFAGPFHAALAAMLLIGWGIVRIHVRRTTALLALAVGVLALYLTLVRSAYAGVALMVVALIVVAPSFGRFIKRSFLGIAFVAAIVGLVLTQVPNLADTALSILDFASDDRFLNRLPEYAEGIAMFKESAVVGMGAGSAGDTLGPSFQQGEHVTPHNMFLKIIVEGGIVGALAWLSLVVAILRGTDWHSRGGRLSLVSFAALVGLGLTGSAIDTLPVSFLVFFFAGLAVDSKHYPAETIDGSRVLIRSVS